MEVDHIIPESVLDAPVELASVVASYGLEAGFNVNSFENWQPSCDRCNREKSDTAFVAVPIIAAQLERAKDRAPQAREIERRTISDRRIGSAIAQIEVALTAGDMNADRLQPLVQAYLNASPNSPVFPTCSPRSNASRARLACAARCCSASANSSAPILPAVASSRKRASAPL